MSEQVLCPSARLSVCVTVCTPTNTYAMKAGHEQAATGAASGAATAAAVTPRQGGGGGKANARVAFSRSGGAGASAGDAAGHNKSASDNTSTGRNLTHAGDLGDATLADPAHAAANPPVSGASEVEACEGGRGRQRRRWGQGGRDGETESEARDSKRLWQHECLNVTCQRECMYVTCYVPRTYADVMMMKISYICRCACMYADMRASTSHFLTPSLSRPRSPSHQTSQPPTHRSGIIFSPAQPPAAAGHPRQGGTTSRGGGGDQEELDYKEGHIKGLIARIAKEGGRGGGGADRGPGVDAWSALRDLQRVLRASSSSSAAKNDSASAATRHEVSFCLSLSLSLSVPLPPTPGLSRSIFSLLLLLFLPLLLFSSSSSSPPLFPLLLLVLSSQLAFARWYLRAPCAPGPELAQGHRVSRPRGTGSVGDSVSEGPKTLFLFLHAPLSPHPSLAAGHGSNDARSGTEEQRQDRTSCSSLCAGAPREWGRVGGRGGDCTGLP